MRLLLEHPHRLVWLRQRWRWILADEFQDTSHAQATLVNLLAGPDGNLCVCGDDDQLIHGWRHADHDYERTEVRDALAPLNLIENPVDAQAFRRAIGSPRRGIGAATVTKVVAWALEHHGGDLISASAHAAELDGVRAAARMCPVEFGSGLDRVRGELAAGRSTGHVVIATVTIPGEREVSLPSHEAAEAASRARPPADDERAARARAPSVRTDGKPDADPPAALGVMLPGFAGLIAALYGGELRFVVIGAVAVGAHGHVRATQDLDTVPEPRHRSGTQVASDERARDMAEHHRSRRHPVADVCLVAGQTEVKR